MTALTEWDVVIAGAGPCGLTLANHLGMLGIRTLVLETLPALIDYPRGVGLDDESLRSFQAIQLTDSVRRHSVPNQAMRFIDRRGRVLVSINPQAQPFGWPRRSGFIQPLIDRELAFGLDRFPHVQLSLGHGVEGVVDNGDHVRIKVQSKSSQDSPAESTREITARFLVGCDGGRSAVRGMLAIPFDGKSESTKWLVIDIANDPIGTPNVSLVLRDDFPYVEIALPHGIRRFEFLVPTNADERTYEETHTIRELLKRVLPAHVNPDIIRHRVYTHHARIAPSFRRGNVFLAGDAAHLMPVWQGQGFNTGIRDATNLAWKLALAVQGRSGERLLDTYTEERHAHAAAMIDLSVLVGRIFVPGNALLRTLRNVAAPWISRIPSLRNYIAEMRFKPMPFFRSGAIVHAASPDPKGLVGKMMPQPWISDASGQSLRLDDAIGLRFALVSWSVNVDRWLGLRARRILKTLDTLSIVVRPPCQLIDREPPQDGIVVTDRDDELRRWFDIAAGSVVVLRPDRIVAAVCMPCDLDTTLDALARAMDLVQSEDPASSIYKAEIKPSNPTAVCPASRPATQGVAA
ncbi:bifunctional 3-(3-hydroxy-phenyl)propionate/3-hydroxycinnamic acid hydroxylase [Ottowia thiooxydans]|uniref:3-(3-hydroxy-phenyl)propionate hydroxylase n=1 Tax=Ottowia thiooxydans TaxID=219182 RepID=A0ABV2QG28_9BURK